MASSDVEDRSRPDEASRRPLRRRRWTLLVVVIAGLVVTGVYAGTTDRSENDPVRSGPAGPAPEFALPALREHSVTLTLGDRGGRPAVINFWASWCVPCRREMPTLQAAYERYRDDVWFVGVNHQDSRTAAAAFLDETGAAYPSAYDPAGTTALEYGLFGLPTTVFVTVDGTINAMRTGEITTEDLDRAIADLLPHPEASRHASSTAAVSGG